MLTIDELIRLTHTSPTAVTVADLLPALEAATDAMEAITAKLAERDAEIVRLGDTISELEREIADLTHED